MKCVFKQVGKVDSLFVEIHVKRMKAFMYQHLHPFFFAKNTNMHSIVWISCIPAIDMYRLDAIWKIRWNRLLQRGHVQMYIHKIFGFVFHIMQTKTNNPFDVLNVFLELDFTIKINKHAELDFFMGKRETILIMKGLVNMFDNMTWHKL